MRGRGSKNSQMYARDTGRERISLEVLKQLCRGWVVRVADPDLVEMLDENRIALAEDVGEHQGKTEHVMPALGLKREPGRAASVDGDRTSGVAAGSW